MNKHIITFLILIVFYGCTPTNAQIATPMYNALIKINSDIPTSTKEAVLCNEDAIQFDAIPITEEMGAKINVPPGILVDECYIGEVLNDREYIKVLKQQVTSLGEAQKVVESMVQINEVSYAKRIKEYDSYREQQNSWWNTNKTSVYGTVGFLLGIAISVGIMYIESKVDEAD